MNKARIKYPVVDVFAGPGGLGELNEGNVEIDTQDRLNSLFRAMKDKTITYEELTA